MIRPKPSNDLPETAIREFEKARHLDWACGVALHELLNRINRVAESFLPEPAERGPSSGRVKMVFTKRSFRHYQTLGCIDVPEKQGHWAVYGHRHFVQALLVRRLLWERVSAERIVGLMAHRSTEETQDMFLHGVEFVARTGNSAPGGSQAPDGLNAALRPTEKWNRWQIAPGVELHLHSELPKFHPTELQRLLKLLEQALREDC